MSSDASFNVVGLFAGIGGLERGLARAGGKAVLLCENWAPAKEVLSRRFGGVPLAPDITQLVELPEAHLVAAGFPCTDLSQAGRTAGMAGEASSLVFSALTLVERSKPSFLLLENVPNMLVLHRGRAIETIVDRLEDAGYAWAYRVIDSRAFGLPQRRRRVFLLASREVDPASRLLAETATPIAEATLRRDAFGFYWTEGNRGLGWATDATPTLKGSSGAGIPSPPAVWMPKARRGRRIVTPTIEAAEALQGFPAGWTATAPPRLRWKLVGNAVSVPVAAWIGRQIVSNTDPTMDGLIREPLSRGNRWPTAAAGAKGKRWVIDSSEWPVRRAYRHLHELLDTHGVTPLSARATNGFRDRLVASRLRYSDAFRRALDEHLAVHQ